MDRNFMIFAIVWILSGLVFSYFNDSCGLNLHYVNGNAYVNYHNKEICLDCK